MKNKIIEYYRDRVYGVVKFYVKDPKIAEAIRTLTARVTISEADMSALKVLGFEFQEVLSPKLDK